MQDTYYLISQKVDNQVTKFDQLLKYMIFFFKDHAENEVGRVTLDLFLCLNKALYKIWQVVSTLVLVYFGRPRLGHTIKTNFIKFQVVVQF